MNFFAVYLESKRFLAIKSGWIQKPAERKPSIVFHSPNPGSSPVFNLKVRYYLNTNVDACYKAFIYKGFTTFKDAQRYVLKKRLIPPVKYNTGKKFEKKFKKPKMVDMIDCDPISVPITLNNRHGLLPWVPRNVQFQSGRNLK